MPIFGGYVSSLEGIFSESMNGWFFNGKLVGKYTVRPMDPVGIYKLVGGWFNPSEKIFVKLDHLPKVRDENTKCVRNNHCFQNDAIMCGNCFFPNDLWSQLLFFCFKKKRFHKNPKTYILGCPPAQDSSHHQDWFLLFFAGDPETKPSFATVSFHRESFRKNSTFASNFLLSSLATWRHRSACCFTRWRMEQKQVVDGFFVSKWDGFTISRNIRKMIFCENWLYPEIPGDQLEEICLRPVDNTLVSLQFPVSK